MSMPQMVLVLTVIVTAIRPGILAFAITLPMRKGAVEFVTRLVFLLLILFGWCRV